MSEVVQLRFVSTDTVSADENLLRAVITFFFNLGGFDDKLRDAERSWDGKPANLQAHLLRELGAQAHREVLAWIAGDPLAKYIYDISLQRFFRVSEFQPEGHALSGFMADRFKAITDYSRKRLPKDLKKSFYTKAANRLRKFAEAWYKDKDLQKQSIEDHLKVACSNTYLNGYRMPESLLEINALYRKMVEFERLDNVVEELMRLAGIVTVMSV